MPVNEMSGSKGGIIFTMLFKEFNNYEYQEQRRANDRDLSNKNP